TGVSHADEHSTLSLHDALPIWMALEKLHPEVVFQFLHRLGDGRLRNGQVLRGTRHGSLLGDRDKILELTDRKGHGPSKYGGNETGKRTSARPERSPEARQPAIRALLSKEYRNRRDSCCATPLLRGSR